MMESLEFHIATHKLFKPRKTLSRKLKQIKLKQKDKMRSESKKEKKLEKREQRMKN
jgi:hypothetical protein